MVYAVLEDPVDPNLLFADTEFGVFFSPDGGGQWVKLTGGIPTIAFRDMAIQERETDLVFATFSRGFYVRDDYSPLRGLSEKKLQQPALLFPVKPALAYVESTPLGGRGKASQGDAFFTAPNPPFGATFTYPLKASPRLLGEQRHQREAQAAKEGRTSPYPTPEQLREEAQEEEPAVILTVQDLEGNLVRRFVGSKEKGIHRVSWDLRFPPAHPAKEEERERKPWQPQPWGPMVAPGAYQVTLSQRVRGVETPLAGPQRFAVVPLGLATLAAEDWQAQFAFQRKVQRLQRAVLAFGEALQEVKDRLGKLKLAAEQTPGGKAEWGVKLRQLERELGELELAFFGHREMARRNEPTPPSIRDRVQRIVASLFAATAPATNTQKQNYEVVASEFGKFLRDLHHLVENQLRPLEEELERAGAPHTPGRLPRWQNA
ncbi:MAG: hypothetical protein ACUVRE_07855 [Thermoanaerobaculaceae bacterium]